MSQWREGQIEYLEAADKAGSFAFVALGADAAMEGIDQWLKCYGTQMMKSGLKSN